MSIKHKKSGRRSGDAAAGFMPVMEILTRFDGLTKRAKSSSEDESAETLQKEDAKALESAAALLKALLDEGIRTPDEVLDLLYDFRLQAAQSQRLRKRFEIADVPIRLGSESLCPSCMKKLRKIPEFCPNCGKKLKSI